MVTLVGRTGDDRHGLDDYRGLAGAGPVLAFAFTVFLLAQAGVPLTSGFFAKFYVIGAAVDSRVATRLAIIAMLAAVIAAFLYLRIIVVMYMAAATRPTAGRRRPPDPRSRCRRPALVVAVGVHPGRRPPRPTPSSTSSRTPTRPRLCRLHHDRPSAAPDCAPAPLQP